MANCYTVEKEINGVKYKAQFNGISAALDAVDNSYIDGTTTTSIKKISEYVLRNVIVVPANLTIDDFESMDEFNEVINFGRDVMMGNFREEKDKKSAAAKNKE